jgi:hypothetical protein
MIVISFAQMAATILGTVLLAHIHLWLAAGAWGGKLAIVIRGSRRRLPYLLQYSLGLP